MKYNAFISYRHLEPDQTIASRIQKDLEHYHIPYSLKKLTGKRITRVFRDKEELPITPDLNEDIKDALLNSEFLIVICSPNVVAEDSYWVPREIEYFLQSHKITKVLTVIADGEKPADVIPEILKNNPDNESLSLREPLSCDYRLAKRQAYKEELPRLIASLIGCEYNDLMRRQQKYRNKIITVSFCAMLCLITYFGWSSLSIRNNYRLSLINQSKYLANEALQLFEEKDVISALQLSMAALPSGTKKRPIVAEAVYALSESVSEYTIPEEKGRLFTSFIANGEIMYSFISKNGRYLVTISSGSSYTNLYVNVWDNKNHSRIVDLSIPKEKVQLLVDLDWEAIGAEKHFAYFSNNNEYLILFLGQELYKISLLNNRLEWSTRLILDFPNRSYFVLLRDEKTAIVIVHEKIILFDLAEGIVIQEINTDYQVVADTDFSDVFFDPSACVIYLKNQKGFFDVYKLTDNKGTHTRRKNKDVNAVSLIYLRTDILRTRKFDETTNRLPVTLSGKKGYLVIEKDRIYHYSEGFGDFSYQHVISGDRFPGCSPALYLYLSHDHGRFFFVKNEETEFSVLCYDEEKDIMHTVISLKKKQIVDEKTYTNCDYALSGISHDGRYIFVSQIPRQYIEKEGGIYDNAHILTIDSSLGKIIADYNVEFTMYDQVTGTGRNGYFLYLLNGKAVSINLINGERVVFDINDEAFMQFSFIDLAVISASPDARYLVISANSNKKYIIIDYAQKTYNIIGTRLDCFAWSDDSELYACSCDNILDIVNIKNKKRVILESFGKSAQSMCFSPDSKLLFIQYKGNDNSLYIYDTKSGALSFTVELREINSKCSYTFIDQDTLLVHSSFNANIIDLKLKGVVAKIENYLLYNDSARHIYTYDPTSHEVGFFPIRTYTDLIEYADSVYNLGDPSESLRERYGF